MNTQSRFLTEFQNFIGTSNSQKSKLKNSKNKTEMCHMIDIKIKTIDKKSLKMQKQNDWVIQKIFDNK